MKLREVAVTIDALIEAGWDEAEVYVEFLPDCRIRTTSEPALSLRVESTGVTFSTLAPG